MFDIKKLNRRRNIEICLKCGNYQKKKCILNNNIDSIHNCLDFDPTSNLSKEEIIESWKNIQIQLESVLITNKKLLNLLYPEKKLEEYSLSSNLSKEELSEIWKNSNIKLIQISEENIRLHKLLRNNETEFKKKKIYNF